MTGHPTERLRLRLNGRPVEIDTDQRALLVEVIRDLGAKGTRVGCLTGDCGACTVELDGRIAKSCLVLAVSVDGSEVVTIEGNRDAVAAATREAFKAHRGFQCGYLWRRPGLRDIISKAAPRYRTGNLTQLPCYTRNIT